MGQYIKTDYMDSPNLGYSEFFIKSKTDLNAISPKPGDRAIVANEGKIYICIDQGQWERFGNTVPSDEVVVETSISDQSTNDDVAGAGAVFNHVKQEVEKIRQIKILDSSQIIDLTTLKPDAIYELRSNEKVRAYTKLDNSEYYELFQGYLFPRGAHGDYFNAYIFMGSYKTQNNQYSQRGIIFSSGSHNNTNHFYPIEEIIEKVSNKTTTLSSSSTNEEYPSAKAVYDFVTTQISSALLVDEDDVI